jgi:hypothetical protein
MSASTNVSFYQSHVLSKLCSTKVMFYQNHVLPKSGLLENGILPNGILPKCGSTKVMFYQSHALPKSRLLGNGILPNSVLTKSVPPHSERDKGYLLAKPEFGIQSLTHSQLKCNFTPFFSLSEGKVPWSYGNVACPCDKRLVDIKDATENALCNRPLNTW